MAVAFGSVGAIAVGTTSLSVAYPASISAGDLLVLHVQNKYPTNGPSTPSGWTQQGQATGGAGASGGDSGNVYVTVFTKVADGTESGSLSVTLTGANNAQGVMARYTRGGSGWDIAAATGSQNTISVSWSITAGSDPGITAGDVVLAAYGWNGNTNITSSAQAITATGISAWGTVAERADGVTNQGDDSGIGLSEHPVTTGTATAAPVFTVTLSGSAGATSPAGAAVFLRLRETAGGSTVTSTTSLSAAVQSARSAAASVAAAVQAQRTGSASASAAVQKAASATAALSAAAQALRAANAAVAAAVQDDRAATASTSAALQVGRSAAAALSAVASFQAGATVSAAAAIQQARTGTSSLSAYVQGGSELAVSLSAALLKEALATAGLDLALEVPSSRSVSLASAVQIARTASAALSVYLQGGSNASAAVSAALQQARTAAAAVAAAVQVLESASVGLSAAVARAFTASLTLGGAVMQQRSASASLGIYIEGGLAPILADFYRYDVPAAGLRYDLGSAELDINP